MNLFSAESIRNVCVLGHGGSGKTSLVEAILSKAKVSERFGKISDGTTVSDYDPEEIKRQISINMTVEPYEWKTAKIGLTKVNLIDTPGYFDFVGDAICGVRVCGSALIVVNAKNGVQVGTEQAYEMASNKGMAKMFFVSNMDDEYADFAAVVAQLKEKFGKSVAPFRIPIKDGKKIKGYVNVVSGRAFTISNDVETEIPIPDDMVNSYNEYHEFLLEAVAESSEEMLERYLEGDTITDDEMRSVLKEAVRSGVVAPVYGGFSTGTTFAVRSLMDAMLKYLPTPIQCPPELAERDGEPVELLGNTTDPLAAMVFKTVADPYVGKMSIFRVYSGVIRPDSTVYNPNKGVNERIGKIYMLRGKKQIEVSELRAGDIGAVTKLAQTQTGDTLCSTHIPMMLSGISLPKPNLSMAIVPKSKGDEEKINSGLTRLSEEDPTFTVENNVETKENIISGLGDLHLEVICSKLQSKFGVGVNLAAPTIPYRETIRKSVKVQGRHKKQSGGHGQFGDVWIEFSPHDGDDLIFEESVFGGAVPKNYFPAVEKGLRECIQKGPLAGYPVVGLKAVLVDGSYHPVDSSEMAFKMAASIAYKDGLPQASPVLLEPVGRLEVVMPESQMGDITGDINKRRGRILDMSPIGGGKGKVTAEVPLGEMARYSSDLRSMTQGRGSFSFEFVRYEEAPANVAQKIVQGK
ncbi:MAG: elongation factor G [Oscillospiraceae bacterium]|nr:elongation factor G [Oscillospiraceae bacterium]